MMYREVPFISVVIPTHNRRELLRAAIESLFKQSYPKERYEIIVVDNSSTDGTEELIRLVKAQAPCFFEYLRKPNEGPGVARNLGIAKARGSIIAFTEDDCVVDARWLQNGVAKMGDGVGLVQGKTVPNPSQTVKTFSKVTVVLGENASYQTFNMFYRRNVLDIVGGFSPDFIGLDRFGIPMMGGEDTDLAWRVKKLGWKSLFTADAVVYHHVFHGSQWKSIINYRMCQSLFYVLPYLMKKHPELRNILLYRRFFLTKRTALFDLFLISVVMGLLMHYGFFILAIPYLALQLKRVFKGRSRKTYHRGLCVLASCLLHDLIVSVLLICGSIQYRSVIL